MARRGSPDCEKPGLYFQAEFVEMDLPRFCCSCALTCHTEEPYNGVFLTDGKHLREKASFNQRQGSQQLPQWAMASSALAKQTFPVVPILPSSLRCTVSVRKYPPSSPGSNFYIACKCDQHRGHVDALQTIDKAIKDVGSRNSPCRQMQTHQKKRHIHLHTHTHAEHTHAEHMP